MTMDIDKYVINKDFVLKKYLEDTSDQNLGQLVSVLACSTMCPCVVIAFWLGEASNWNPLMIQSIKSLTKFYGYTNIENGPQSTPEEIRNLYESFVPRH